jgi:hypothetical protein
LTVDFVSLPCMLPTSFLLPLQLFLTLITQVCNARPPPGTNYASADCGAILLSKYPRSLTKASSVLNDNKDTYSLGLCRDTKEEGPYQTFTVELCDEILVTQVTLANFEFFSSQFHR